ncbi:MAG: MAPEG family protein [Xanthomonadales bacterium]|nr:MAPEG family protein [Xanthomonadales bacterium]
MVQIALVMLICALAYRYGPGVAPQPADTGFEGRLAFVGVWLLVPALAVLAFTIVTMLYRLFSPDAIAGTRRPASRYLEINIRVTQNTLEQAFLAAVAWFGLALALPAGQLALIPVLAVLFGVGRILFWVGYQLDPAWRAIGFGLTALPTAIALLWLGSVALSGLSG